MLVDFDNRSQGAFTSVEWDFGDGRTSTSKSPDHRYSKAGTYSVRLKVSGPGGADTSVMSDIITVEPGPLVKIKIFPAPSEVAVQEGIQFTAEAQDTFGNMTHATFDWTTNGEGGSITAAGFYTADTLAGTFEDTITASLSTVRGQLAYQKLTGSAPVTVKPGPVASVTLEPAVVAVEVGESQQFTFRALDRFGTKSPMFPVCGQSQPRRPQLIQRGF